jgi:hypothetical protein
MQLSIIEKKLIPVALPDIQPKAIHMLANFVVPNLKSKADIEKYDYQNLKMHLVIKHSHD